MNDFDLTIRRISKNDIDVRPAIFGDGVVPRFVLFDEISFDNDSFNIVINDF